MTKMSNEAIQAQLEANKVAAGKVTIGEDIASSGKSAVLYSDSAGTLQEGTLPFAVKVTGANDTTFPMVEMTGRSSLSADQLLTGTFVQGAQVTTFTATGFIQVNLTDNGGNITDGVHYLQVGTLT